MISYIDGIDLLAQTIRADVESSVVTSFALPRMTNHVTFEGWFTQSECEQECDSAKKGFPVMPILYSNSK